ncbi:Glycosyl transferase [Posidoniimonas polymericola]|uniref:Lipid-A-disaccharide synthase n=1 Tax=Posidoniimonas polymericola TaxID=2528002 RepID=A0A5C5YS32_9BACT|nr:lipid-A-disaccharide synthase [Posidoniimonas polymericola]TWT77729.1 Glycosyl transferase [Posidoniimonas polymericola]
MNIFFSVGEPSGDLHGANLIRELKQRRPDWKMVGYGGPRMQQAGCELHTDLTQFAVMWLLQVILNYHKFRALVKRAERYFAEQSPDAVVLIDYPGFNWHIAKAAKKHGVPVFYYGAPQLWGWAGWRVKKMRRWVDHVLVKLPFEEPWYRDRGCNATYLGHPYFDELRAQQLDQDFVRKRRASGPLVTILPGSRTQEVRSNLAAQLQAAEKVRQSTPGVRFAVAVFKQSQVALVETELAKSGVEAEVHVGRTPELIHAATCCLAVSGSVSLELLFHTKPTAIVYQVSPLAFFVQKFFRRVRYITLVNLLTADELFPAEVGVYDPEDPRDAHVLMPEYLTCQDPTDKLARHLTHWLTDDDARDALVARMAVLKEQIGRGGASVRAAEYVVNTLDPSGGLREAA